MFNMNLEPQEAGLEQCAAEIIQFSFSRWNNLTCIYKLCQLFFPSRDEECVPSRINTNLQSKI